MTNAERYLKDGVDVEELRKEFEDWYAITRRANTPANYLVEFLNEQVKPELTEDERVILRNIGKEYLTITREDDGDILIWTELGINTMLPYDHLFQFIKERRRISNRGVIEK